MHFGRLDLGMLGVILCDVALVVSIEMHFRELVSTMAFTDDSPNDGARTCVEGGSR
jgi:hypothetical protein